MSSSSRRLTRLATAAAAAVMLSTVVAPALAAPVSRTKLDRFTLSSGSTTARFCATRSVTGAGTDRQRYVAPADGFLTARLSGGSNSSDWDLAVVDAKSGKALDGSAGTTSYEIATAAVRKGQALWLQGCRHAGAAGSVSLNATVDKLKWSALAKEVKGQKVVLARVKLRGRDDAIKLRRLGLDVADHALGSRWDATARPSGAPHVPGPAGPGAALRPTARATAPWPTTSRRCGPWRRRTPAWSGSSSCRGAPSKAARFSASRSPRALNARMTGGRPS
jgi:hypothetical protein